MPESKFPSYKPVRKSIVETTIGNPFTYTAIGGTIAFLNPSAIAEKLSFVSPKGLKTAGAVVAGISAAGIALKAIGEYKFQQTLHDLDEQESKFPVSLQQESKWVDKTQNANTANIMEKSGMSANNEVDNHAALEAIRQARKHIGAMLENLYFAQDNLDLSRHESKQFVDILSYQIVNDINRINLISKTLSKNEITQSDEKEMENIRTNFKELHNATVALGQTGDNAKTVSLPESWAERITVQQEKSTEVQR